MIHAITLVLVSVSVLLQAASIKLLMKTMKHISTIARDPLTPASVAQFIDDPQPG